MDLKRVLSYMRRAVEDYDMIRDGDRIAVGVSAGKDSLTLLAGLAALRRFYSRRFEVVAVTVDLGFDGGQDYTDIEAFCREIDVPFHVAKTDIGHIIFDIRKEKSPCALCSKMRRAVLHDTAKALGCNTVALGHHLDDVVDTFMLNLFYEGRVGCFEPVSYLSRVDLRVIRPLIYMPEKDILYFLSRNPLPVHSSPCPADGETERTRMHDLISDLEKNSHGLRYRIFGAILRGEIDGFHPAVHRPRTKSPPKSTR